LGAVFISMGLLRELLRKYLGKGMILVVCSIVSQILGLLNIDLGRRIIDVISSQNPAIEENSQLLLQYGGFMLFAIIAYGTVNYLVFILVARLSQSVVTDIRLKLFNHILKLPQNFHARNPVGQIMSRIFGDVEFIGRFFSNVFLLPITNVLMIIFYTAYVFHLNWKLAIAGTFMVPFIAIVLPRYNRKSGKLSVEYSNGIKSLFDYIKEAVSGVGEIRSHQTFPYEESKLKTKMKGIFDVKLKLAKTDGGLELVMNLITSYAPLIIYLYGGLLCINGELSVGTLIATIIVIGSLYDPMKSFVNFLYDWPQLRVAFNGLNEYLDLEPEGGVSSAKEKSLVPKGSMLFDKVQFGFNDKEILLEGIDFKIDPGLY